MANLELHGYIKSQLAQNVSREIIVNNLIAGGGWTIQDIEEAFLSISIPQKKSPKALFFIFCSIVIFCIAGGACGYFLKARNSQIDSVSQKNVQIEDLKKDDAGTKSTSANPSTVIPATPVLNAPVTTKIPEGNNFEIASCRQIGEPGIYALTSDIVNTKTGPCVSIKDAKDVTLNCDSHSITSQNEDYNLYVKNSLNFVINDCKLVSKEAVPSERVQHVLRVENSKQGHIKGSVIAGNFASVSDSSYITLINNKFSNQFSVYKSNNIVIKENSFSSGEIVPIGLSLGNNNSVISNFIDGNSDGEFRGMENSNGADDGIVISDESNDLIQDNTLKNFFDCAIENSGFMFDTKIIGNKADNMGVCFLGGWYNSSVKDLVAKDNIVNNSPNLFYFYRAYALKPTEKYVYFQNNLFENNRISNPKLNTSFSYASRFFFNGGDVPLEKHILGNNILKNNDFGKSVGAIRVFPANLIVDGGGNTCPGAEEEAKGGGDPLSFNCN